MILILRQEAVDAGQFKYVEIMGTMKFGCHASVIVHSRVLVLLLEWTRDDCWRSRRADLASNLVASLENIVQVASMFLVDGQLNALLNDESTEWRTDLLLQETSQLFQGLDHRHT